jgi:2-iminobutanoate/2-iminopropanoate deaminase
MEKVYTKNAPDAIGPYSQAIKANGLVFTSGQIAINPATGNVEAEGIEAQTEQVCTNLKNVLEAAGSSLDKAVKTVCFLADMNDFAAFNAVYGTYFTGKPARSCVAVKTLPKNVLADAMAEAGLSPTARAEELTMAQFVRLSDALPDGCVAPR